MYIYINMIIIFDTYGGLCNQFYDINCGINFCIINNIKFTFRYCTFRNNDLTTFYNEKFNKLFDMSFLDKYSNLYINYDDLDIRDDNTYNFDSKRAIEIFTNNFENEIINCGKEYIILKQFWSIYEFKQIIDDINPYILPSKKLVDIYNLLKDQLINDKYNFIHYRYEIDFTSYFKVQPLDLKSLILNLKQKKFKNSDLKIYIATSNIKQLIDLNDIELCDIILTKNDDELNDYNFEERAFIDYMFGLHSCEVFGHSKSSFSHMLNDIKQTSNYYD